MNIKTNLGYIASIIVILTAILILIYICYLLFLDGNNIITYNGPMKVYSINNESIDILIDYCKYEVIPLTIYPSYVDGIIYNLQSEYSGGSEVGCYVVHRLYDLPKGLPNGEYHFQVRNEFKVNPLKTVIISWKSEEFNIKR